MKMFIEAQMNKDPHIILNGKDIRRALFVLNYET